MALKRIRGAVAIATALPPPAPHVCLAIRIPCAIGAIIFDFVDAVSVASLGRTAHRYSNYVVECLGYITRFAVAADGWVLADAGSDGDDAVGLGDVLGLLIHTRRLRELNAVVTTGPYAEVVDLLRRAIVANSGTLRSVQTKGGYGAGATIHKTVAQHCGGLRSWAPSSIGAPYRDIIPILDEMGARCTMLSHLNTENLTADPLRPAVLSLIRARESSLVNLECLAPHLEALDCKVASSAGGGGLTPFSGLTHLVINHYGDRRLGASVAKALDRLPNLISLRITRGNFDDFEECAVTWNAPSLRHLEWPFDMPLALHAPMLTHVYVGSATIAAISSRICDSPLLQHLKIKNITQPPKITPNPLTATAPALLLFAAPPALLTLSCGSTSLQGPLLLNLLTQCVALTRLSLYVTDPLPHDFEATLLDRLPCLVSLSITAAEARLPKPPSPSRVPSSERIYPLLRTLEIFHPDVDLFSRCPNLVFLIIFSIVDVSLLPVIYARFPKSLTDCRVRLTRAQFTMASSCVCPPFVTLQVFSGH